MSRIAAERSQRALLELAAKPGNDVCADCKASLPRWASHNLGIFICMNCASVHRKLGTHITKVKHLTMDEWSKEQVENMRQNGNIKSNAYYNPNEARNPPPTSMTENERDSELERFIRSKYEYKRFIDKSPIVAAKLGPSQSLASRSPQPSRAVSTPVVPPASTNPQPSSSSLAAGMGISRPYTSSLPSSISKSQPARSLSQPLVGNSVLPPQNLNKPLPPSIPSQSSSTGSAVWNDLISLQGPSVSASLPLQQIQTPPSQTFSSPAGPFPQAPGLSPYPNMSLNTSVPMSGSSLSAGGISPMAMQPTGAFPFQQQTSQHMIAPNAPQMMSSGPFPPSMTGLPAAQFNQPQTIFQPQGQHFAQQSMLNQSPVAPPQPYLQPSPQPGMPMQQGFMSSSPQPQLSSPLMPYGTPQNISGIGGMGGMGMQMQQQASPYGQVQMPGQQQQQPQMNQFTSWMQASAPGQQSAFQGQYQGQQPQGWGGM